MATRYRKITKYKYQILEEFLYGGQIFCHLPVPCDQLESSGGFVVLTNQGILKLKKGYAWNGTSGPILDTKYNMKASLIHDALYQLIGEGLLPESYRKESDILFRRVMIYAGMNKWIAWSMYFGLRFYQTLLTFCRSKMKFKKLKLKFLM